ncbi:MAG TPA: hypothetical protein VGT60_03080, partial [Candidatus Limnocylindria bacterium]|nr:hypothetical protein [Candidatus Limnocylindria bacterium]
MVVAVEEAAARGPRTDVAGLIDGLEEVGQVGGSERVPLLEGECCSVPAHELFIAALGMMDRVAALHRAPGGVEARELRVADHRAGVELDEPRVLLLDHGVRAGLARQPAIVDRAERRPAGAGGIPVHRDAGCRRRIAAAELAGLAVPRGENVRRIVARHVVDERAGALIEILDHQGDGGRSRCRVARGDLALVVGDAGGVVGRGAGGRELLEERMIRDARTDVTGLIDGLEEVGQVGGSERVPLLEGECCSVPAHELF